MRLMTLCCVLLLSSCGDAPPRKSFGMSFRGEPITRSSHDLRYAPQPIAYREPKPYPWDRVDVGGFPPITDDSFRCKGSRLHPHHTLDRDEGDIVLVDCDGAAEHSLPLVGGEREGVYPILIDLLNYVQEQTKRRVIITCGHRCPKHNTFADPRPFNRASKHMIGAEVDFYVQGMEEEPEAVIALLLQYYQQRPEFIDQPAYRTFRRYHKDNTDVATPPWYNKEVFIKLYACEEGRDFDNRHPYPYIGLQVRFDRELKKQVAYTWKAAHCQCFRR